MTKIKDLTARLKSCPYTKPFKSEFSRSLLILRRGGSHVLHASGGNIRRRRVSVMKAQQRALRRADCQDEQVVILWLGNAHLRTAEPFDDCGQLVAVANDHDHASLFRTDRLNECLSVVRRHH